MNSNCCQSNASCATDNSVVANSTDRKVSTYLPSVDILESSEAIVITADVPGANAKAVEVTFEDDTLTLRAPVAARESETRRPLHREYGLGDYLRSFTIHQPIDRDRINARLLDGVLTLTLPKSEAARPRKIAVQAGQN